MALHPPVSVTDEYLSAVHDRLGETNGLLRQVLDRLPEPAPAREPGETVELREPAVSVPPENIAEPVAATPPPKRPARKRPATPVTKEP